MTDYLKDIASGTVAGIAQTIAGHPLDTVKVRLQTQVAAADGTLAFDGMGDCFRKTWSAEGLAGLYRGVMSPLAGAAAHNAGVFFSYGFAKRAVAGFEDGAELTLSQFYQVKQRRRPDVVFAVGPLRSVTMPFTH